MALLKQNCTVKQKYMFLYTLRKYEYIFSRARRYTNLPKSDSCEAQSIYPNPKPFSKKFSQNLHNFLRKTFNSFTRVFYVSFYQFLPTHKITLFF